MISEIIISPHVTEKSMQIVSENKYTFIVRKSACKPVIIDEIKKIYNVNPINIQIQNYKGKNVTFKHRYHGKRADVKKAIITLPKKEKIKDFIIKENK